ncbi:ribonuclease J, partial [Candidatus Gracilibacteria bacterium]|nr:ribonuclease J [Candidatus Gracilibacteria bacterium]
HSIPDCVSIVIDTPVGRIVHTGDFKFDETPARNMKPAEVDKMEQVGKEGVLALLCESTNSTKPGHTISEKEVGEALDQAVGQADGRVILASFSSQIGRIQQVIDAAHKHGRKIYVSGRSMQNNIENATKLGYLYIPKGCIADIRKYDEKSTPAKQTLLLTTGSQGEPMSALTRIARGEHSHVRVTKGDTIIFSSSPIVGNERAIYRVINSLCKIGANVIHNQIMDVHTSGHGKQEELARMINYMKPKYLIPIHGEYYMRQGLGDLAARECGIPANHTILLENGKILVVEKGEKLVVAKETVETKYVLIDGHGEGTVDSNVIVDREVMSQNGCITVLVYVDKKTRKITRNPDIISRGFIYMHELDQITKEVSQVAVDAYNKLMKKDHKADRHSMKRYIKQSIDRFAYDRLQRKPLIVPLIIEG